MTDGRETSSWAAGGILFAGLMMIMVGIWQALEGLIAIFENEFYVATRNYLFQFDATTWGWIHLIVGVIVAFAGWGLLSGRTWARVVAITLAVLSAIANFLWLPYYPFWSLLTAARCRSDVAGRSGSGRRLQGPAWSRCAPVPPMPRDGQGPGDKRRRGGVLPGAWPARASRCS
jgi:hypothetical protein